MAAHSAAAKVSLKVASMVECLVEKAVACSVEHLVAWTAEQMDGSQAAARVDLKDPDLVVK